jgi:hypothetical protein
MHTTSPIRVIRQKIKKNVLQNPNFRFVKSWCFILNELAARHITQSSSQKRPLADPLRVIPA